ncbi:MAG: DUF3866 family protein [Actinomycetaceae bacterium]|nr:DUF3866 family protein [Actinomycetaceae bacterium]
MQRQARLIQIQQEREGLIEGQSKIIAHPPNAETLLSGEVIPVLALTDLVGEINVGDSIRIECSALAKSLGTGGFATVISSATLPGDKVPQRGHIMKARYTPHQTMVLSVEELDSPYRKQMELADDLHSMPVVVADLHSALAPILLGSKATQSSLRIAYIHDDSAALPAAFSNLVSTLRKEGYLSATITCGQAFGGDLEAVSLPSGLLAARHVVNADVCIVAPGPGVAGTGTKWGFSGTATATALNVASALGGIPIAAVRGSNADARGKHRGISHHSLSVLSRLVLASVDIPLPRIENDLASQVGIDTQILQLVDQQLTTVSGKHSIIPIPAKPLWLHLQQHSHLLSTMGRGLETDPLAFLLAAASGAYAASAI